MMSSTPDHQPAPPPPPQPPLPPSDPAFTLPEIVDGIDPTESPVASPAPQPNVFTTLSAHLTQAVNLSKSGITRAVNKISTAPPKPRSLFLFGDSITDYSVFVTHPHVSPGWSALLRELYENRVDVFVRGFSGYNTRWALHILPSLIAPVASGTSLKAVVIFFGANDATHQGEPQHVPLDEYAQNLSKIIAHVNTLPGAPLPVLITPPALSTSQQMHDKRTPENTALYAEACVETGRKAGVPVVDLHAAMIGRGKDGDGIDQFLSDGLHLSASGNRLVYELLIEIFRECVPELGPDELEPLFPPYSEIDPANPALALGTSSLAWR